MELIDDAWLTLKRSYTLWLTYIMIGSGMAIVSVNEFELMPPDWASWVIWGLKWVIFACTILQIPARVIKQPGLPSK